MEDKKNKLGELLAALSQGAFMCVYKRTDDNYEYYCSGSETDLLALATFGNEIAKKQFKDMIDGVPRVSQTVKMGKFN